MEDFQSAQQMVEAAAPTISLAKHKKPTYK